MELDFFTLGLAFILLHELDAIRCHEWRIFPLTSFMNDRMGMQVFLLMHLPLFYFILVPSTLANESFQYWFSVFLIAHFFAHLLF